MLMKWSIECHAYIIWNVDPMPLYCLQVNTRWRLHIHALLFQVLSLSCSGHLIYFSSFGGHILVWTFFDLRFWRIYYSCGGHFLFLGFWRSYHSFDGHSVPGGHNLPYSALYCHDLQFQMDENYSNTFNLTPSISKYWCLNKQLVANNCDLNDWND